MVLLQLTPALEVKLRILADAVPAELAKQLWPHLDRTAEPTSLPAGVKEEGDTAAGTKEKPLPMGHDEQDPSEIIEHDILVKAARWARKDGSCTLASLLRLTDVYAPPLTPRIRSAELEATLSRIQLNLDRSSYADMVSLNTPVYRSVLPLNDIHDPAITGKPPQTVVEEWKEVKRELAAIVNVGASMAAVGTGVWWVGGGRSYAARLCLAMSGAVAIALIEAFLYYRFFTRGDRTAPGEKKAIAASARHAPILQFDDDDFVLKDL